MTGPRRDWVIAGALFLAGAAAAMVYNATWGGRAEFWQQTTFMQGILYACGHGWENPRVSDVPGLEEFLYGGADCFDCGAIPEGLDVLPGDTRGMTLEEINAYHPEPFFFGFPAWQRCHLYLVLAVTGLWCVFGVCWSALGPLAGLLYGTTVAAAYGIFRLGMGRAVAAACAVLVLVSPLHLQMAPHLRDLGKAPFILLAILLLGHLAKRRTRPAALLGWSAVCGAVAGVGLGFRADLIVIAPAFPVVAVLLLPGRFLRTLPWRLAACGVFAAAFTLTGLPILLELFREAGHFAHVLILGLLSYCDGRLGVGSPLYELGGPFSDFYVINVVQTWVQRGGTPMPPATFWGVDYHEATQVFLRDYAMLVPGDLVARACAAVLRVLDELRVNPAEPWPRNITNPFLQQLYALRALAFDHLPGQGRYHAAAALALMACRRARWAFAALFVLLYFAGYTALQFNLRHLFYLEFMSLWATGFLVQRGVEGALLLRGGAAREAFLRWWPGWRTLAWRVAVVAVVSAAALAALLQAARWRQHHTLGRLLARCDAADLVMLAGPDAAGADGFIPLPDALPPGQEGLYTASAYLAVALAGPGEAVPVTFRFRAEDTANFDYTRTIAVETPPGGVTRLYFPVYQPPENRFEGLHIPPDCLGRLEGVYRVENSDGLPFWLTLRLPPGWRSLPRHQAMTR